MPDPTVALWSKTLVHAREAVDIEATRIMMENGSPLQGMAKAQLFRYFVLARLESMDLGRFEVTTSHRAVGRVQLTDTATGQPYLLKSETGAEFEVDPPDDQLSLFDMALSPGVWLVTYAFDTNGAMRLSCTPSIDRSTKYPGRRYLQVGERVLWGLWAPHVDDGAFDQGEDDDFEDLFGATDDMTDEDGL